MERDVAAAGSVVLSLPASGAGAGRNLTVEQNALYTVQAPAFAAVTEGERLSVVAVCSDDDRPVIPSAIAVTATRDLTVVGSGSSTTRPVGQATVAFAVTQ